MRSCHSDRIKLRAGIQDDSGIGAEAGKDREQDETKDEDPTPVKMAR
jgi:hypothetical protein